MPAIDQHRNALVGAVDGSPGSGATFLGYRKLSADIQYIFSENCYSGMVSSDTIAIQCNIRSKRSKRSKGVDAAIVHN
jgi:hypothetical protein